MTGNLPISAFIIAHNEADRIGRAIASVRGLADEVIVINSGSSDATVNVSESAGARVVYNDWPGYGLQKRFGEEQCRHRWLLNLDADEELTPELAAEIRNRFAAGEPEVAGFVLRIRDLLPGETKLAPFAHTNYALRLYNRTKARFSESPVHDSVIVREGETLMLDHPMLHRSFRSIAHALEKINSYSSVQAANLRDKEIPFPVIRLCIEFPIAFFKTYFLRGYILRGWRGFIYSAIYSFGRFIRIAKYLERKNRP
jgi:glycosyltransferase involved in cell wall biosynthesis